MDTKTCSECRETKPIGDFSVDKSKKSGYMIRCKPCDRARARRYYTENRDKRRAYDHQKAHGRAQDRLALRKAALRIYGGVCVVCGTAANLEFDHVNGDGRNHRKLEGPFAMVRRIVQTGERLTDVELQLLCFDHHHEKSLTDGDYGKRYAS
jgi:hypothetical protein